MGRDYLTALLPSIGMQYVGGPMLTQGKALFVRPGTGSDGNKGNRPDRALATLAKAKSLATANQNDVVFLMAESNTAASTTDYQSATLDWSKDGVHLIGVNANTMMGQRSRVAFTSAYNTASNLFTVSANNCLIANIEFFAGVAGTSPTGCMSVTGMRNHFLNCQIAGIGHANNNINGAYSLSLTGASENLFENCVIGLTTIARSTATVTEIVHNSASAAYACRRNIYKGCIIQGYCTSAGNYLFFKATDQYSSEDYTLFEDCLFVNALGKTSSATMTQAMSVGATINGVVVLKGSTGFVGVGNVNASDTGVIYVVAGGMPNNVEVTDLGIAVIPTNA